MKIKDAQQIQMQFEKCVNVEAYGLRITAPETSPNTDGIHVTNTQNIQISNSVIGTGICSKLKLEKEKIENYQWSYY